MTCIKVILMKSFWFTLVAHLARNLTCKWPLFHFGTFALLCFSRWLTLGAERKKNNLSTCIQNQIFLTYLCSQIIHSCRGWNFPCFGFLPLLSRTHCLKIKKQGTRNVMASCLLVLGYLDLLVLAEGTCISAEETCRQSVVCNIYN